MVVRGRGRGDGRRGRREGIGQGPQAGSEEEVGDEHGCHTARAARTHPLRRVDQEDHQGPGADRDLADRQGAGPGRRRPGPTPTEITNVLTDAGRRQRAGSPAARRAGEPQAGRRCWWSRPTAACAAATTPTCCGRPRSSSRCCARRARSRCVYVIGRKALGYYRFRNREVIESWTGFSEQPTYEDAQEIADDAGRPAFMAGADDEGDDPGRGRHPRRRRAAHRLHRVQVDAHADRRGAADRADGGRVRRASEDDRSAHAVLVRAGRRRRCSTRCCPGTSRPASTRRCWRPRRRSRRRAGAR